MTMQACGLVSPVGFDLQALFDTAPFMTSQQINAGGEKVHFIFRVPVTGLIRTIRIRLLVTTTGQTLRAGIYTVDSAGLPTTTAYGGMAVGTVAVADGDDNVEKVITLGTDASATEGDLVAVGIEFDGSVGDLNIASANAGSGETYSVLNGAKVAQAPILGLGYSDGTYPFIPGVVPFTGNGAINGMATTAFNVSTGTFDEYGLLFQVPFKVRLKGMKVGMSVAAAADFEFNLHGSSSTAATAIQSASRDGDSFFGATHRVLSLLWPTPEVLDPNTARRLTIRPTSANSLSLGRGTVGTLNAIVQACGYSGWQTTRRLNEGNWDDSLTTELPFILPIFDQLSDDAGGGGPGSGAIATREIGRQFVRAA